MLPTRTRADIDTDLTRIAQRLANHERCSDTVNGVIVYRCPEGRDLIAKADALLDERLRLRG